VVDVPGQPGNKAFAVTVLDKGQNRWSVQMRHRGLTLEQDIHIEYGLRFGQMRPVKLYKNRTNGRALC